VDGEATKPGEHGRSPVQREVASAAVGVMRA